MRGTDSDALGVIDVAKWWFMGIRSTIDRPMSDASDALRELNPEDLAYVQQRAARWCITDALHMERDIELISYLEDLLKYDRCLEWVKRFTFLATAVGTALIAGSLLGFVPVPPFPAAVAFVAIIMPFALYGIIGGVIQNLLHTRYCLSPHRLECVIKHPKRWDDYPFFLTAARTGRYKEIYVPCSDGDGWSLWATFPGRSKIRPDDGKWLSDDVIQSKLERNS